MGYDCSKDNTFETNSHDKLLTKIYFNYLFNVDKYKHSETLFKFKPTKYLVSLLPCDCYSLL